MTDLSEKPKSGPIPDVPRFSKTADEAGAGLIYLESGQIIATPRLIQNPRIERATLRRIFHQFGESDRATIMTPGADHPHYAFVEFATPEPCPH
jgi:hypothetical protein